MVHRFTPGMLRGAREIRQDRRPQVVLNMEGFGNPRPKRDSYRTFVATEVVRFTGFKLFYRQDVALMTVAESLALWPVPHRVIYP